MVAWSPVSGSGTGTVDHVYVSRPPPVGDIVRSATSTGDFPERNGSPPFPIFMATDNLGIVIIRAVIVSVIGAVLSLVVERAWRRRRAKPRDEESHR